LARISFGARVCDEARVRDEEDNFLKSKQRRHLPDLQRAEKHRAVDKAQRKGPRLFAFQHRFLAERVDSGGDADIGVLLDHLAEAGNRATSSREANLTLRCRMVNSLRNALDPH